MVGGSLGEKGEKRMEVKEVDAPFSQAETSSFGLKPWKGVVKQLLGRASLSSTSAVRLQLDREKKINKSHFRCQEQSKKNARWKQWKATGQLPC